MRFHYLYLSLLLTVIVSKVVNGQDEFDALDEVNVKSIPDTTQVKANSYDDKPAFKILEVIIWLISFIYIINYILGNRANRSKAESWLKLIEPHLSKQFHFTGSMSGRSTPLVEEAGYNFKYFATGRRFCSRFMADLQLNKRHDLFVLLFNMIQSNNDKLTLDIGMNAKDMDPFILCLSKKEKYKEICNLYPELSALAKQVPDNEDITKLLPSSFLLACDNQEIPGLTLSKSLRTKLQELEPWLEYIIVTDCSSLPIVGFPLTEKRFLRLQFDMTADLDMEKVISIMALMIDSIGTTLKLSSESKSKALNKRKRYTPPTRVTTTNTDIQEDSKSTTTSVKEHELREQAIKQKKKEEYEKLSYDEQQKWDEREEKKRWRKLHHSKAK